MPDLTVIEGGGERRDWNREISQQHVERFVVALLRSLAVGDGAYRVTEEFFRFLEHAQESKVPIGPILEGAIRNLHGQAFDSRDDESYDAESPSENGLSDRGEADSRRYLTPDLEVPCGPRSPDGSIAATTCDTKPT